MFENELSIVKKITIEFHSILILVLKNDIERIFTFSQNLFKKVFNWKIMNLFLY